MLFSGADNAPVWRNRLIYSSLRVIDHLFTKDNIANALKTEEFWQSVGFYLSTVQPCLRYAYRIVFALEHQILHIDVNTDHKMRQKL